MSELPEKQVKRLKSLIQDAETNLAAAKELLISILGEDGQVIADHTEAKHLLDLLRTGCRPYDQPVPGAVQTFNEASHDGADMSAYSQLLTDAIHSMIDVTEERDIDSLFTPGPTTALTQTIAGLDDFELTAFIVVVNSTEEAGAGD